MSGLTPAGVDAHAVIPVALQSVTHPTRPTPAAGNDGRDWIIVLEIDAYQIPAP